MFADHGPRYGARGNFRNTKQGRLEEYTPFYSIMLPSGFKKDHPEFYRNIKANTEVLTVHFDAHVTLKHILSYPDLPKKHKYGQSLFTKIDPVMHDMRVSRRAREKLFLFEIEKHSHEHVVGGQIIKRCRETHEWTNCQQQQSQLSLCQART